MRIGIDLLALQSPGSRRRGVGRYGDHLVRAMIQQDPSLDYLLYIHEDFPIDEIPQGDHVHLRQLGRDSKQNEWTLHDVVDRLARQNPDCLDLLLTLNPFELCPGYDPPPRPLNGLKLAAVVHDLIPAIFQEKYLDEAPNADWFYRRLRLIQNYDLLLTNSEATRRDCLRFMGLPESRVVTIGGAADHQFFKPSSDLESSVATSDVLTRLGIRQPYVFHVGGMDDRKNIWGLMDAFARLSHPIRLSHLLVVSCLMDDSYAERVRSHAKLRGLEDRLILTGSVSDEDLRVLYQECSAFAFPSLYEGFGLPILEAMHCGAAVVAGNNSSQVEVLDDAGLLVNAADPGDIAQALERILVDREVARSFGLQAIERATRFRWESSAERALKAIHWATRRRQTLGLRADRGHRLRPRLAMFSPFNPKGSGISNYSARLLEVLSDHYSIDCYHDEDYVPNLGLKPGDVGCHDHRLFDRRAALLDYQSVVYHMGNSWYHRTIYDALMKHPGIVVLHDFCLSGFHYWYGSLANTPADHFESELEYDSPGSAVAYLLDRDEWHREDGGIQIATTRRGLSMNRRVFERAKAVIVHSPWGRDQVCLRMPEYLDKTFVIPHGASIKVRDSQTRAAIKAQFELPRDSLVLGCFGILSHGKMNNEAIDAFAMMNECVPSAHLIFVGEDWEKGEARNHCRALGLEDRIHFLGRQPSKAFEDLVAITDVGVSLRRPPTFGETSGSLLDLLRSGVATIVNNVGTFADYPSSVVRKVSWDLEGLPGLSRAMLELLMDHKRREALGQSARHYVEQKHDWSSVARQYAQVIERVRSLRVPFRDQDKAKSLID